MSEAKCVTGWGDLSTRVLLDDERPSPHPAANCIRGDPPPPGEGEQDRRHCVSPASRSPSRTLSILALKAAVPTVGPKLANDVCGHSFM
jgi:hypothetical protein